MMFINSRTFVGSIALAIALSTIPIQAQDQPAEKSKPAAKAPAAKTPPGANRPSDVNPAGAADRATGPAVDALLAIKPEKPADIIETAEAFVQLGRSDLAKPLIKQLLDSKPDANALADLERRFGGGTFLQFADNKQLQPESRTLVEAVLKAAHARAHDPAQLAAWIQRLANPSPDAQREALDGLVVGGTDAAALLVGALADPAREKIYPQVRALLAQIGSDAVGPLVAALDANDPAVDIRVIDMLANLGDGRALADVVARSVSPRTDPRVRQAAQDALVRWIGSASTKVQAIELLNHDAREYLDGQRVMPRDEQGNVPIWQWDSGARLPRATSYPPQRAAVFVAARLARQLHLLAPEDLSYRRLYLVSLLESAMNRAAATGHAATAESPEISEAAQAGIPAINDVLAQSLATGHTPAGVAAARILADHGDTRLLAGVGGETSPLVKALASADPQLRFAATEAVMKLKPTAPFNGSGLLTRTLANFATATGGRKVLVAFPTIEAGQQLAALLRTLGVEPETATTGRQLTSAAADSADCELLLISDHIDHPPAEQLIQELRRDPQTAWVPIGLMAEAGDLDRLQSIAASSPLVFVLPRPVKLDQMKRALDDAARLAEDRLVPPQMRQQQAIQALDWLAALADGPTQWYDVGQYESLLERTLFIPALSPHAAEVMARLGTRSAQLSLVDLAGRSTLPLAVRQAAAVAFSRSVRRRGLRLSSDDVLREYGRYNLSSHEDKATQELLGLVLDAIELPKKAERAVPRTKANTEGPKE